MPIVAKLENHKPLHLIYTSRPVGRENKTKLRELINHLTGILFLEFNLYILEYEFVGECEPERHPMTEEAAIGRLQVVGDAVVGAPRRLEHTKERLLKLAVLVG